MISNRWSAVAVWLVAVPCFAADAPFTATVGQRFTYDTNVFRLGTQADTRGLLGTNSRADRISTTQAGVLLDTEQERQRIRLSGVATWWKFDRFSQLDHTGRELDGAWQWRIGDRLDGELRGQQSVFLTPFQDFRVGTQAPKKSRTTSDSALVSGNYWLLPDWSVGAAAGRTQNRYSALELAPARFHADYADALARYRPPTGSEVSVRYRHTNGQYPDRIAPTDGQSRASRAFKQDELIAESAWRITAASRIDGSLGFTRRRLEDFIGPTNAQFGPGPNFSGVTGRLAYDWQVTAASGLNLAFTRGALPLQSNDADYAVVSTIALVPRWAATATLTSKSGV